MTTHDWDWCTHGNITLLPVLHGRYEFGREALRLFRDLNPDVVAVEFPATIGKAVERGLDRLPHISVVYYEEKNGRFVYLPLEPQDPIVAAAYLARSSGLPLHFIDRDTEGYQQHRESFPDPYTVTRLGLKAYVDAYVNEFQNDEPDSEDRLREMTMAFHLQALGKKHQRVLGVLGLAHYQRVKEMLDHPLAQPMGRPKREGVSLANLAEESCREILSEMPFMAAAFAWEAGMISENDALETKPTDTKSTDTKQEVFKPPEDMDRLALHRTLIDRAAEAHQKNAKEEVSINQKNILFKFARNYSLIQNHLTPDFYQLLVAARGAVDDNFAYEVWDIGSSYPWHDPEDGLPTLRLRGEDLYLDTKRIRFYRSFRQFRRRLISVPVKKRKKEKKPGEWKDAWHGHSICSHQPEDIVIEGFGDYLKKKTLQILSEENRRSQPFLASMMDGLDMRETIRNWHENRLYVTESRPVQGKVGSVVLIFDEDDDGREQFPWMMTWLGEHEQESDMAFYSTPAGEHVVGPGISRCEYGGMMLTYPPLRLYDIWRDPFFDGARTKSERLLLAGIDYSEEKLVAYIAAKPPSDRVKNVANLYGKKVVYLPIGQFSPVTLKKVRSFHVLDGHQVRRWAQDYIY